MKIINTTSFGTSPAARKLIEITTNTAYLRKKVSRILEAYREGLNEISLIRNEKAKCSIIDAWWEASLRRLAERQGLPVFVVNLISSVFHEEAVKRISTE